ncbi:GNAT family N-acetyltransferase [Streptomyces sp. VRA16 Mangrove soil]|uniref:GNAT family N-acetyltransferase n=1 Tax=Streptomyces sp. VRA16 Mangrove soil TaxID=2817434 RepID=UPI001A9F354D|nr:GNAT family N-acetyltransferase [Streptomyces sp. VRA16 Mangrove soil]MBO1332464.1 GNAT family N-acetyltransferase [Streptomyces sp. VRA16 Mangrove soil]
MLSRAQPARMAPVFANFRQYLLGWETGGRPGHGVDRFRSGLAAPQFNGVVRLVQPSEAGAAVAVARRELAGVPWWWWVGPDSPADTAGLLRRHGGREVASLPVMVRSLARPAGPPSAHPGLRVEEVRDARRLAELVSTYRTSMGIGSALQDAMVHIESRRADNGDIVRLAALREGRVVGTTTVIAAHGVAGIFLVHVAEEHRRQGVGVALTAAALRVGRERGMDVAALVASPAGEALYRRFDFTPVWGYRLFDFPA